jgi:hypothetical protein
VHSRDLRHLSESTENEMDFEDELKRVLPHIFDNNAVAKHLTVDMIKRANRSHYMDTPNSNVPNNIDMFVEVDTSDEDASE